METVKRVLAIMTWCGVMVLLGTFYIQPRRSECAEQVRALSAAVDFSYFPGQGCQVEVSPGVWASWNEVPVRAPQLLKLAGCTDVSGMHCA